MDIHFFNFKYLNVELSIVIMIKIKMIINLLLITLEIQKNNQYIFRRGPSSVVKIQLNKRDVCSTFEAKQIILNTFTCNYCIRASKIGVSLST